MREVTFRTASTDDPPAIVTLLDDDHSWAARGSSPKLKLKLEGAR